MLVIGRKVHQKIIIGDGESKIEIMVTEISGAHVKIGVEAPKNLPVHREEVYKVIKLAGGDLTKKPDRG